MTLQCYIGFAIHQHGSTMGVHMFPFQSPLPPPSPLHPCGSSQCTSPEYPVSCIKLGLEIRFTYDIIHVSMSLISWLQSPSAVILKPRKIKSATVSTVSPSISHEVMGPDAMIFVFWMLSFEPTFPLSCFTFIKRLFSSSSHSAIRVVSSAYLRLLIFLPAILIPACSFSSPAFLMMYSAYNLNKHGDNIQPWRTPFPIWNQSVVPCYSVIKKNTFESVLMKWMKLEPIIQSEVSQEEKHQYSILMHVYEI